MKIDCRDWWSTSKVFILTFEANSGTLKLDQSRQILECTEEARSFTESPQPTTMLSLDCHRHRHCPVSAARHVDQCLVGRSHFYLIVLKTIKHVVNPGLCRSA